MLHGIYTSYQDQCALFFTPAALTPENHAVVIGSMFDSAFTENDLIGIQPETCLTPFFTGDLLRAIFNYEIPQHGLCLLFPFPLVWSVPVLGTPSEAALPFQIQPDS